ncbi:excalibur calcium-binding domain-containing protein [Ciceribacter selenitireducens]|uniref:excalibur calcium-binding domain-containing protein n=1 Tax=Ciceribacter selenitireducens TaxID=448181 RepID=UPI0004B8BE25|nr:excalibur calcium-binding domain-containing protein [Ciceribacter selenitireducens]
MDRDDHIVFNRASAELTVESPIANPLAKLLILSLLLLPPEAAEAEAAASDFPLSLAAGRTCKQVASCAEAVELWCSGYRRADADGDGIPCENICHSRAEVDQIRSAVGC